MTEGRLDVFVFPHTAFRGMLNEALATTATCFFLDDDEAKAAMNVVKEACRTYREHGHSEDEYWGKPLAEKEPELAAKWAAEHAMDHLLDDSSALADQVIAAAAAERAPLVDKLYATLNEFIGKNLSHMHMEETEMHETLWKHFSDDELRGMQGAMLAAAPAWYMQNCGGYFIKHHGFRGRVEFLRLLKGAPPFEPLMGLTKSLVSAAEFAKIESELSD